MHLKLIHRPKIFLIKCHLCKVIFTYNFFDQNYFLTKKMCTKLFLPIFLPNFFKFFFWPKIFLTKTFYTIFYKNTFLTKNSLTQFWPKNFFLLKTFFDQFVINQNNSIGFDIVEIILVFPQKFLPRSRFFFWGGGGGYTSLLHFFCGGGRVQNRSAENVESWHLAALWCFWHLPLNKVSYPNILLGKEIFFDISSFWFYVISQICNKNAWFAQKFAWEFRGPGKILAN